MQLVSDNSLKELEICVLFDKDLTPNICRYIYKYTHVVYIHKYVFALLKCSLVITVTDRNQFLI